MAELRVLGTATLTGLAEADARAIVAQPKRLALLAYLAVAPGELCRRDTLLALLWPQLDQQRARAALRSALYFLRPRLGQGILESRGDAVGLDRERVWCDARMFETRIDAGEVEEALALYRGDLLEGLHVSAAPEFERWLDGERQRLRDRAASAAWTACTAAEERDDLDAAISQARRAIDLMSDREAGTRRLMELHLRAGDPAAALEEYVALETWLAEEYELAPSAGTVALAARIRARAGRQFDDRSGPERALDQSLGPPKRSLAVLPFLDQSPGEGPGQHEFLADALTEEVIARLAVLRGLRVISHTSTMALKGTGLSVPDIAKRLDVGILLEGSLRAAGGRIHVTAQLVDAASDEHLWARTFERESTDLLVVPNQLADDICGALEVELTRGERPRVRQTPTRDPEAYRLCLLGQYWWKRRHAAAATRAERCFREAIGRDPHYAAAYAGFAEIIAARGLIFRRLDAAAAMRCARAYLERALELDPSLGEAHAALSLVRCFVEFDHFGAERDLRRAVELNPGSPTAYQLWATELMLTGRVPEALPLIRLALDLDPLSPILRETRGLYSLYSGDLHQADQEFERILEMEPAYWRASYAQGLIRWRVGAPDEAVSRLTSAWRHGAWGATREESENIGRVHETRGWRSGLDAAADSIHARVRRKRGAAFELALVCFMLRRPGGGRWLERSCEDISWWLVALYLPLLDGLYAEPFFQDFLHRVGAVPPKIQTSSTTSF